MLFQKSTDKLEAMLCHDILVFLLPANPKSSQFQVFSVESLVLSTFSYLALFLNFREKSGNFAIVGFVLLDI